MQKITPSLWFDTQAEEAVKLYTSVFKNSSIGKTTRYDEESAKVSGQPAGSVLTVEFTLDGQNFLALNGGPIFKFTEALSFIIDCADQAEVDYFTEKLTADGGEQGPCGWIKDKFGLSWQITPSVLNKYLADLDPIKAQRVMKAMLQMKKIIVADLEKAYQGK